MLNKENLILPYYSNIEIKKESATIRLNSMKKAWSFYGDVFTKIADITNVPVELLFCFGMVESGRFMAQGKSPGWINEKTGQERNYLGVMQISPIFADDRLLNNRKDYNKEEKIFISQNFGLVGEAIALDDTEKLKIYDKKAVSNKLFTKQEMAKTPQNIFLGAQMIISLLKQKWAIVGNKVLLERVIIGYNAGPGKAVSSGSTAQTPLQILGNPNVPLESKNYIRVFLGNGGYLNLWKLHFEK